jgi:hypothetical protein
MKYPYQTVKNGFDFINLIKDISLEAFSLQLYAIYNMKMVIDEQYHLDKSHSANELQFCQFIKPFENKLI